MTARESPLEEPRRLEQIFLGPNEQIMTTLICLIKPLAKIVLEGYGGALARWYPNLDEAIKHAEASRDPELLQIAFCFSLSAIPDMQKWAKPRLDPGRVELFFYYLESLTKDFSCKVIDAATYLRDIFLVIMMGTTCGPVEMPHPRHLDEWRRAYKDGNLPDVALLEGAAMDAALALGDDDGGEEEEGEEEEEEGDHPRSKRRRVEDGGDDQSKRHRASHSSKKRKRVEAIGDV